MLGFGLFKSAGDSESGFFGSCQISKNGSESIGRSGIGSKLGNAFSKQAGSKSAGESSVGAKFGNAFANEPDSEPAGAGVGSHFRSDGKLGDVEPGNDAVRSKFRAALKQTSESSTPSDAPAATPANSSTSDGALGGGLVGRNERPSLDSVAEGRFLGGFSRNNSTVDQVEDRSCSQHR